MYTITMGDCAGVFGQRECRTIEEACGEVWVLVANYPSKMFAFSNSDMCDDESDGLTEQERDALYDAETAARRPPLARCIDCGGAGTVFHDHGLTSFVRRCAQCGGSGRRP